MSLIESSAEESEVQSIAVIGGGLGGTHIVRLLELIT